MSKLWILVEPLSIIIGFMVGFGSKKYGLDLAIGYVTGIIVGTLLYKYFKKNKFIH
jgi:hypothetical protein